MRNRRGDFNRPPNGAKKDGADAPSLESFRRHRKRGENYFSDTFSISEPNSSTLKFFLCALQCVPALSDALDCAQPDWTPDDCNYRKQSYARAF